MTVQVTIIYDIVEIEMSDNDTSSIQYHKNMPMKTFNRYMNKLCTRYGAVNFRRLV